MLFDLVFSRQIMVLLRTPANILDDATTYLNIYFLGLPFLFMYNVLSSMFNALGKSRIPLYLLIFSSLLNIGLDIWMVGPLQMGVAGAAWATLIAQGISAVLSFSIFLRELKTYPGKLEGRLFGHGTTPPRMYEGPVRCSGGISIPTGPPSRLFRHGTTPPRMYEGPVRRDGVPLGGG